jgi:hypothetical protein
MKEKKLSMLTVPPNLVNLIFAERLLLDRQRPDVSLIGIFQEKTISSVPSAPVEMVVFLLMNGARGVGLFELAVYRLDPHGEHKIGEWIYRKRLWFRFPENDPNRIVNIEIPIKSLRFPDVGEYLFELTVDGKHVTERRILIHG